MSNNDRIYMENDRYSKLFKGKIYINVPTALYILLRKFNSLIVVRDKMITENKGGGEGEPEP